MNANEISGFPIPIHQPLKRRNWSRYCTEAIDAKEPSGKKGQLSFICLGQLRRSSHFADASPSFFFIIFVTRCFSWAAGSPESPEAHLLPRNHISRILEAVYRILPRFHHGTVMVPSYDQRASPLTLTFNDFLDLIVQYWSRHNRFLIGGSP